MKTAQSPILLLLALLITQASAVRAQSTPVGQAAAHPATTMPVSTSMPDIAPTAAVPPTAWLLHLPGIGGKRSIDLAMTRGFKQGGFTGQVEIYDWTENHAGLNALIAYRRNHKEAKLIADKITQRFDKDPAAPIYLSCHSGGGGLAIWALEYLPARVMINTLVMMSPALSPQYDLTAALRHVSGKVYVFSSTDDVLILETGCKMLGTIDGVKTAAAGFGGFIRPPTGDVGQYAKLVPMPYNPQWVQYDDFGNHVGGMTRLFGREVLAPLVLSGKMPLGTDTAVTTASSENATAENHPAENHPAANPIDHGTADHASPQGVQ